MHPTKHIALLVGVFLVCSCQRDVLRISSLEAISDA